MSNLELRALAQTVVNTTRESMAYRAMLESAQNLVNACAYPDFASFEVYESAANVRDLYRDLFDTAHRRSELASIDFAYAFKEKFHKEIPFLNCYQFARQIIPA